MQLIKNLQPTINQAISDFFTQKKSEISHLSQIEKDFIDACEYAVSIGGKRIRPTLAILSYEAISGKKFPEIFYPIIIALEFIHAYSLVHDDLPALDNDTLRRGHPTVWKKYGESTAILVGDALLTFSTEIITESLNITDQQKVQLIKILNQKSGAINGMISGQIRDISSENTTQKPTVGAQNLVPSSNKNKISNLENITITHHQKTGSLIQASGIFGSILADGSDKNQEYISQYAQHIGLAFQIKDDLLDLEGEEKITGKKCQKDYNIKGYIYLMGIKKTKKYLKEEINKALKIAEYFQSSDLKDLAKFIKNRTH